MWYVYIINGVHGPEPRSSGGNTSSNPQVSALIPRPVFNGIERMCQRHGSNQNSHSPVLVRKPLCNQCIHYHISSRGVFGINHFKLRNFAVVATNVYGCFSQTTDFKGYLHYTQLWNWSFSLKKNSHCNIFMNNFTLQMTTTNREPFSFCMLDCGFNHTSLTGGPAEPHCFRSTHLKVVDPRLNPFNTTVQPTDRMHPPIFPQAVPCFLFCL